MFIGHKASPNNYVDIVSNVIVSIFGSVHRLGPTLLFTPSSKEDNFNCCG